MSNPNRPPLECTLCGIRMWNDEHAHWVHDTTPGSEPEPYCSQECLVLANAEYAWDSSRRTKTGD